MCFNKKTTVTKTGLGDDQYKSLYDKAENTGVAIEEGFTGVGGKLDGISGEVTGLGGAITDAAAGVNENTNTGFTNLTGALKGYGDSLSEGQSNAAAGREKYYNDMLAALENNTGGLATQASLDTGFSDATNRFNDVDQANSNIQGAVDQGFIDAQADRTQMGTDMTAAFDTQNTGLNTAFNTLGTEVGTAFDATNSNIDTTRGNLTDGQTGLASDLSTLTGNVDAYGASLIDGQTNLQSGQDTFKSSFDDYVDRYTDDTEIANKARSDRALAASNQNDALREDLGRYAQAAAEGQSNIGKKIGSLGDATGAGFEVLSGAVEGGFSNVSAEDQSVKSTLVKSISGVRDLLQTTGDNLDASTKAQYSALADSFDDSGDLITNAIDSQGNTIQRSMDNQGRILESRFDGSGAEISSVAMDVETMLSNAEGYQNSLMGNLRTLSTNQDSLMGNVDTLSANQDAGFKSVEGINTAIRDQGAALATGFDAQSVKMDTTIRDLARVASAQSDIDMGTRQEFKQLSDAFDDQGNLIANSVGDNGSTISRAIDNQGNLLLRAFDTQGRTLGDKYIDINKSLRSLNDLQNVAGANAGMGNLTPAMQAGSGGAVTSGFASPYATTR